MDDSFPRPIGDDEPSGDAAGDRVDALPAHERDDPATVGGGLTSSGGTAIDRGTGTLGGQAQGATPEEDAGLLPSAIDLDDHERFDADDRAKPGIDDHAD